MKRFILTLFIITMALTSSPELLSQGGSNPLMPQTQRTTFLIGPVFGYNRSLHSASIPSFQGNNEVNCPVFANGSQNGYYVGGSFEYLLGGAVNSTSSIIIKAVYNTLPSFFEEGGDDLQTRVIEEATGAENIITTSIMHNYEVDYSLISLEGLYKLNLGNSGFGIVAGPTFDFAIARTRTQTLDLIEPSDIYFAQNDDLTDEYPNARYSDDLRSIIFDDGDIEGSSAFRLGLKVGAQYEIDQVLNKAIIVPHIFYNFGITNLSADLEWRVSAVQIGFDIRWAM